MTDTLAQELRAAAKAISDVAEASRCWSVISTAVTACTDHIAAIAGNIEKNSRLLQLEAGSTSDDPLAIVERVGIGVIERRVASALALRFGLWTDTSQLLRAAYGDFSDGGPDYAEGALKSACNNLRHKLRPHGLAIEGVPYHGRRMVRI